MAKPSHATFAEAHAAAYLADPDRDAVEGAATEGGGQALVADVTSSDQVEAAVQRVVDETGSLDIVVNNAGIFRDGVVWRMTDEDWDAIQAVHLGGTFRLTRAAVPHFRKAGYGRLVNVTSFTGLRGNIGQANYAAAKAGIIGFTKTTAKELARCGVTVNAISPKFGPATSLTQCWQVWIDDVDVNYRGLTTRLEPATAVLEAAKRRFERWRSHEFIGSPRSERDAARALARERVEMAVPYPELCRAVGQATPHRTAPHRTAPHRDRPPVGVLRASRRNSTRSLTTSASSAELT